MMYSKKFMSEKRAKEFAEQIEKSGAEDIKIWSNADPLNLGMREYTVKWNVWK